MGGGGETFTCFLASDMNLKIRSGTVGYNNKILVSNSGFTLGKNDMVNMSEKSSHRMPVMHAPKTSIIHSHKEVLSKHTSAIAHEEEKIPLVLVLTIAFGIWYAFIS